MRPVLLRADNFTPPSRTPWGGRNIVTWLKPEYGYREGPVGESWELSVEPDFPSTTEDGLAFSDVIAADPAAWLGPSATRADSTSLLVKLLDAADDLSVQIHPSDEYEGLGAGEGGKPESWYVVHAAPDAVLYIGLAEGVTRSDLERALDRGEDVSRMLGRVPVSAGDFFLIEAGMPHAVGRGITLVEPQTVAPGQRGLTYRFWDWNRRYDANGRASENGTPRPLHREHALAVTRYGAPRGEALLTTLRVRAGAPVPDGEARLEPLAGEHGPLVSASLEVARLSGTGTVGLPTGARLRAITVLDGTITLAGVRIEKGRTAAVPASLAAARVSLERAHAIVSSSLSDCFSVA